MHSVWQIEQTRGDTKFQIALEKGNPTYYDSTWDSLKANEAHGAPLKALRSDLAFCVYLEHRVS
jgi:hypothetical protein